MQQSTAKTNSPQTHSSLKPSCSCEKGHQNPGAQATYQRDVMQVEEAEEHHDSEQHFLPAVTMKFRQQSSQIVQDEQAPS
jgi:hypothetical protein